ncbi:hypothetical protein BGI33_08405 [Snodgrassella alvi]|uniref:Uncharacterized protein n=1 Tax=Snodgrassella alvi TaxID=1196083 RepID=A0A2N9WTQ4_9NEIS|nr:hypothetical protein BGI33_08405 [Snodgrassella alvi]PIT15059.1 hypothetical protein BGI32_06030 [Snodgrassella alvi]PIT16109.1 hypothetical protein BGI34_10225 [Snodgrassella alvi]
MVNTCFFNIFAYNHPLLAGKLWHVLWADEFSTAGATGGRIGLHWLKQYCNQSLAFYQEVLFFVCYL